MPTCSTGRSELDATPASASQTSRILIVRHGTGRGPAVRLRSLRPAYCQDMFDDINRRWPALAARIDFWQTGEPLPDLNGVAAVLFLLQDPLAELYPRCFADSMRLAERAKAEGIRLVNDPESLSNTIKTNQARIWRESGLLTPACQGFNSIDELYSIAEAIDAPVILKSDFQHSQTKTLIVEDIHSLKQIPESNIAMPGSLSPLVDTRSGYRALDPDSPYATHYHKKRAMVFGTHVRHNHVFFSTSPVVGCVSSSFGHYRSLNPIRHLIDGRRCRDHIRYDLDYHNSACQDADLLSTAARALGVEFCAIDYSEHADGRIELWEANPHFSLHMWPIEVLARQRKLADRTPRIHETAAAFFRDLLGIAS